MFFFSTSNISLRSLCMIFNYYNRSFTINIVYICINKWSKLKFKDGPGQLSFIDFPCTGFRTGSDKGIHVLLRFNSLERS